MGRAHHLGNETDLAALLAIKSRLLDHPTGVLSSWNHSLHHCHWDGVTCGPKHDRVTELNLCARGFVGTISPFIGNMSFLKVVLLCNNSLVGQIPPELGRLFRLQGLGLYYNKLHGGIPTNLSACINLQKLSVGDNYLDGKLPLGLRALSKLKLLAIQTNYFIGPLFEIISNLTSLEAISAGANAFTGNIPTNICKTMINLNFFYVEENRISGTFPTSILNCTALKGLNLAANNFHGMLPPDIGLRLPHLEVLDLSNMQFSGAFPNSILNLTNLQLLDLSNNSFLGRAPHDFGTLHNLWYFNLQINYLEGDINFVESFVNCSQLETLVVAGNEFTGSLPESVANLSISLQIFVAQNNRITGRIPVGITNLINLQKIVFQNNELIGSIPLDLGKLQKLELLYLFNNSLSGNVPETIGNLSRLSRALLQNNQLEGRIPPSLGRCQSLLELDLSSNHLNGTIVELFKGHAKFVSVNVSNNLLEGSIPLEISKQINLVTFFVSQNKLSGVIPFGLGDCSSLKALDIHDNFFHGQIPSSFSSLGSLQTVDLSRNNLSGTIPYYFSKFPLQLLNLSHNNFEGEVPISGVFANISAIALDGNVKLCGGIPKLSLPKCIQQNKRKKRRTSHVLKLTLPSICAFVGILIIMACIYLTFRRRKKVPSSSGSIRKPFMKVSYDMLLKATNGFSSENLMGAGGFGSVFRGRLDGKTVAVKVLNLQTRGASKSFMAECQALRNVRHRNLVGIITACSSIDYQRNDFRALVYEFMPNGSLDEWLHGNGAERLSLVQRVDIAIDVAHALNYLHHDCENPIIHCDLKSSNILLDDDMVAHVADFGLAKFLNQPQHPNQSSSTGIRGTVGYAAPEYGVGSEPSTEGDVYSYGILLLELMTGKRPTDNIFKEEFNIHMYSKTVSPDQVMEIVDSTLEDSETNEQDSYRNSIRDMNQQKIECVISLVSVGVACSNHLPQDRMKITDAIARLQAARANLVNARGARPLRG